MKSLEIVQKIAKVMQIICKVLFILSIVGTACAIAGGIIMLSLPHLGDGIISIVSSETNMDDIDNVALGVNAMASAVIVLGEFIVLKFTYDYLTNELSDGTPFTYRGAKEILRLGIINLAVPIGASVVAMIIIAIAGVKEDISFEYEIAGGVILIFLSFVFNYGAELAEKQTISIAENNTDKIS